MCKLKMVLIQIDLGTFPKHKKSTSILFFNSMNSDDISAYFSITASMWDNIPHDD